MSWVGTARVGMARVGNAAGEEGVTARLVVAPVMRAPRLSLATCACCLDGAAPCRPAQPLRVTVFLFGAFESHVWPASELGRGRRTDGQHLQWAE